MLGMDLLGLGHKLWPVDMCIKEIPAGWAIGCFDTTFGGDASKPLRKMLASGKFPAARVHIWYSKGHKLVPMTQLQSRLPVYEKLAKDFPKIQIYVSHTCEYDEANAVEVQKRVDLIKKLAPSCIPVNAKMKGASLDGVVEESHDIYSKLKGKFLTSTDGVDIYNIDADSYTSRMSKAQICFLWGALLNLREDTENLPEPPDRKAIPDKRYMRALVRLGSPAGEAPRFKFPKKVIQLKKPALWKSFAEDNEGFDVRSNKPLIVCGSKANQSLSVVDKNAKEVCKLAWFGPFENMQRFYSGTGSNLYGYEIGAKAAKQSGSEYVWVKDGQNDQYYGPICPSHRTPYFQA